MSQEPSAPTYPSQHGHRPSAAEQVPATLVPETGWHVLHLFYQVDRAALSGLSSEARAEGKAQIVGALDKSESGAPDQMQCFAVPGHKADFGVMIAGTDLK